MNKMMLFRKTDTTLVYIASGEFAKEIMKDKYVESSQLYIHIKRETGFVVAYIDNDINKVVQLNMNDQEFILKCAETDR